MIGYRIDSVQPNMIIGKNAMPMSSPSIVATIGIAAIAIIFIHVISFSENISRGLVILIHLITMIIQTV